MGAKRYIVDAGGTTRKIKTRYIIDAGGVTRKIKKRYIIDGSGVGRLTFNGNEDDFVVVAGTDGNVHGTGYFHVSGTTYGSLTPSVVLGDGMSIVNLYDDNTGHRTLLIAGFPTAPVATYLASINCASSPALTPATATFTSIFNGSFGYLGQWQWLTSSIGGFFTPGNTYPGVIIRT